MAAWQCPFLEGRISETRSATSSWTVYCWFYILSSKAKFSKLYLNLLNLADLFIDDFIFSSSPSLSPFSMVILFCKHYLNLLIVQLTWNLAHIYYIIYICSHMLLFHVVSYGNSTFMLFQPFSVFFCVHVLPEAISALSF